jgi:hypothetical protein
LIVDVFLSSVLNRGEPNATILAGSEGVTVTKDRRCPVLISTFTICCGIAEDGVW